MSAPVSVLAIDSGRTSVIKTRLLLLILYTIMFTKLPTVVDISYALRNSLCTRIICTLSTMWMFVKNSVSVRRYKHIVRTITVRHLRPAVLECCSIVEVVSQRSQETGASRAQMISQLCLVAYVMSRDQLL